VTPVLVGAGQAGPAVAWHLQRRGLDFTVLDAGTEIGAVWRPRWDSLRLFTAARYGALPEGGRLVHERGLTPAPGLSVIGRHWQTSRGSALLGFVGRDAAELADRITAGLRTTAAGSRRTSPRAA
jgi:phytoene dehydrogenase-like protein